MKNNKSRLIIICLLLLVFLNVSTIHIPYKSNPIQNADPKLNAGEKTVIISENKTFYAEDIANSLVYKDVIVSIEIIRYISVDLKSFTATMDWFFFAFKICNDTGDEIWPTIEVWWDGSNKSVRIERNRSILNKGDYDVIVPAIFVLEGEAPILLNMTISRDGYQDKYYEIKIAIDPATVEKNGSGTTGDFPLPLIITISIVSSGAVIGLIGLYWFKLRKPVE